MLIHKFNTLSEARQAAKEMLREEDANPIKHVDILRRDGDTERHMVDGTNRRIAGWITRGMWVDPTDTPCIIT